MKISRKTTSYLLLGFAVFLGVAAVAAPLVYYRLPDYRNALSEQRSRAGTAITDRSGRILRLFPDGKGRFSLWRERDAFPQCLKSAAIAAEDRRFLSHPGFDPLAVLRAVFTNVRRWRTVSGASTISQQVVRLIQPRPRTYTAKMMELLESIKMERQLSKEEILELYLNLSPMGGNIRGAGLAARVYFGKDVERVSIPEAASLAVFPRSPSRFDPRRDEGRKRVLVEKDRILKRMAVRDLITPDQLRLGLGSTVIFRNRQLPLHAPHFVDLVMMNEAGTSNAVKTTLDLDLQQAVEHVLKSHGNRLRRAGIRQAAALVVSARDAEVLALVGSLGYCERDRGFNNAVLAQRSAGSTLKPFLYALALEKGYASVSEIPDTDRSYPTPHGDYLPLNSDRRLYGPVNVRSALGNSLNISAIKVAKSVGLEDFHRLLEKLEIVGPASPPADRYGLGLAVGNLEVSLYRLVQGYLALARGGELCNLQTRGGQKSKGLRVFSPEAAYVISNVLADPSARLLTFGNPGYFDFGFPVSVKTGTSSNYRDSWVIGYTSRHVVGIWAGNFDGSPCNGRTGATICGPILMEVMRLLYGTGYPEAFARPASVREEVVCSMSGKLATPKCRYTSTELLIGKDPVPACDLSHEDEHHQLGASYARWLNRRETEQGESRYRLFRPEPSRHASAGPGRTAARKPGPVTHGWKVEIINPHDQDRFILSPYRQNRIVFKALPEKVVESVVWFLDGVELARTGPPYELDWEPTRGSHVVHAVTPDNDAARVVFHVE